MLFRSLVSSDRLSLTIFFRIPRKTFLSVEPHLLNGISGAHLLGYLGNSYIWINSDCDGCCVLICRGNTVCQRCSFIETRMDYKSGFFLLICYNRTWASSARLIGTQVSRAASTKSSSDVPLSQTQSPVRYA